MADTNTYDSFQKVEKWTTKEKFNALGLSDIPVGTEYNLTGQVEESDLDSDLQTKIKDIDGKSSVSPITSSPPEGSEVIRGVNIDGSDYSLPRKYRHSIYFNTTPPVTIYYDDENSSEISDITEIPKFIHYPAYVSPLEGKGVLDFYGDDTGYKAFGVYLNSNGEVSSIELDLGEFNQDVTEI